MAVKAEVVLDSISPDGFRLITIAGECHRFIWSQILTHQNGIVRNSASSRAVPVNRNIQRAKTDPALPLFWGRHRPGMGADEEIEEVEETKREWLELQDIVMGYVKRWLDRGLAKEVANRPLEWFLWQQCAITATEQGWENFFRLRIHHAPQKEIQAFAKVCKDAIDDSRPQFLDYHQWHMPFLCPKDYENYSLEELKKISTARTARVSYENHLGVRDVGSDLKLFNTLFKEKPEHASPGAHVCTPCRNHFGGKRGDFHLGGLVGWDQLRHEVECGYDYN